MEMLVIGIVALAAFAAVLIPLFRRRPGVGDESEFENIPPAASATASPRPDTAAGAPTGSGPDARARAADDASADPLEREVQRYRASMRAGTVCRKCGQANPTDSVFCYECGERLPLADAKEFE